MIVGDVFLDRFAFGCGVFEQGRSVETDGGRIDFRAGSRWLRFTPDPNESPLLGFVVVFAADDFPKFRAALDEIEKPKILRPGTGEALGFGNGVPDDVRKLTGR